MASTTVTIPKEEYDFLVKCKHVIAAEFEEKFSDEFIEAVKESEENYKKGKSVKFDSFKEAKKYLDSL